MEYIGVKWLIPTIYQHFQRDILARELATFDLMENKKFKDLTWDSSRHWFTETGAIEECQGVTVTLLDSSSDFFAKFWEPRKIFF